MIFSKDIFYVRASRSYIEVKNLKTGNEISHKVTKKFSNERLLICDFHEFECQLKSALEKVQRKGFLKPNMKIVFQPVEETVFNYSSVEKRSFRDSCEFAGASEVYLYFGKDKLSDQLIIEGVENFFER